MRFTRATASFGVQHLPTARKIASYATVFVLLFAFIPTTRAQEASIALVQRSYSGCFERSVTTTSSTVYLKAPTCIISATNSNGAASTYTFDIINLDPDLYVVTDASNNELAATRLNNTLTVATTIEAGQTATLTVSPWYLEENEDDFWYSAVSDTQSQAGAAEPNPIAVTIMGELADIKPSFITNSGDVIGGDANDEAAHAAEYPLYDTLFRSVPSTLFPVPGDHDAFQSLDYYTNTFGPRDYTFTYGSTRFIGINTTENINFEGALTTAQLTWLEETLQAATEDRLIVLMQHPMVPPDWANSNGIQPSRRLQIASLFTQYGVEAIFTGDLHGWDDSTIDSSDISGLDGSFRQVIVGGAGGKIISYGGDHFYTMVHVTPDSLDVYRIDVPDSNLSVTTLQQNDGTETQMRWSVVNDGEVTMPYIRLKSKLNTTRTVYAADTNGVFYSTTVKEIDGVQMVLADVTDVVAGEIRQVDIGPQQVLRVGVEQTVSTDGTLTFSSLPTTSNPATTLSVASAKRSATVVVNEWDANNSTFEWTETTTARSKTTYLVTNLEPRTAYVLNIKGKQVKRVGTDENGTATFFYKGPVTEREYTLSKENDTIAPSAIGVLPAQGAGANAQLYNEQGEVQNQFFAYDSELRGGYRSAWVQLDDDAKLELVTVPAQGTVGHLRVFEQDGTLRAQTFPYSNTHTAGIQVAVADVNGDGKQEIITAPEGDKQAIIKIFSYRKKTSTLKQIHRFRAFPSSYTGGLNLAVGNVDGTAAQEIIVTPRSGNSSIRVYRWNRAKRNTSLIATHAQQSKLNQWDVGAVVAAGDLDFDGKDEITVLSQRGNGLVQIYSYNAAAARLIKNNQRRFFGKSDSIAGALWIGNVNASPQDELIVTRQDGVSGTQIRIANAKKQENIEIIASIRPFGVQYNGSISLAASDTKKDWKPELLTASQDSGNNVNIYRLPKREKPIRQGTINTYQPTYNLGLQLTQ